MVEEKGYVTEHACFQAPMVFSAFETVGLAPMWLAPDPCTLFLPFCPHLTHASISASAWGKGENRTPPLPGLRPCWRDCARLPARIHVTCAMSQPHSTPRSLLGWSDGARRTEQFPLASTCAPPPPVRSKYRLQIERMPRAPQASGDVFRVQHKESGTQCVFKVSMLRKSAANTCVSSPRFVIFTQIANQGDQSAKWNAAIQA